MGRLLGDRYLVNKGDWGYWSRTGLESKTLHWPGFSFICGTNPASPHLLPLILPTVYGRVQFKAQFFSPIICCYFHTLMHLTLKPQDPGACLLLEHPLTIPTDDNKYLTFESRVKCKSTALRPITDHQFNSDVAVVTRVNMTWETIINATQTQGKGENLQAKHFRSCDEVQG